MKFFNPLSPQYLFFAKKFEDFTIKDTLFYLIIGVIVIVFAYLYRKRSGGVGIEVIRGRERFLKEHPEISSEKSEAIRSGILLEGMTIDEIIACRGNPRRIQILSLEPKKNEIWIYKDGLYLSINDGVLSQWKTHRKLISIR